MEFEGRKLEDTIALIIALIFQSQSLLWDKVSKP